MEIEEDKKATNFAAIFHNKYTAWVVLALSLILTLSAAYLSYYYSGKIAEERFTSRVAEIAEGIRTRMISYEQSLQGGVGLFQSSKDVTRKEFRDYVATLKINETLPGIQGMGYSIPIEKDKKEEHIQSIRAEGFPDYEIRPTEEREEYSSIIYLEPFDWRNKRAFGFDMWSNEMRRNAMTRARDLGVAANSGIITLVQETEENVQKGFLMYLPVYESGTTPNTIEERRRLFKGWVYSPFRAGDLIRGITGTSDLEYSFEIYDSDQITEASLLFDSDSICHLNEIQHVPTLSKEVSLNSQGRNWTLYVHTIPNKLTTQEANFPIFIGVFGFVIDIVLFLVIYSLNRERNRTTLLTAKLEDQKRDIETINKDLSQFAYITSHDLQEPLRTVSNCVDVLKDEYSDIIDEEGQYLLQRMKKSTQRMSDLIFAILSYSRLGKQKGMNDQINCNELVEEIKTDLNTLIEENNASFIIENLPSIKGNKAMIKQLFSNLITNAIKYRSEHIDPIVKIRGGRNASSTTFIIEDNGIGIEEEYQDRIFQIFQRLHTSSEYTGTGIGLSSCRKIAELHNGTISVKSDLNNGSFFTFTLQNK